MTKFLKSVEDEFPLLLYTYMTNQHMHIYKYVHSHIALLHHVSVSLVTTIRLRSYEPIVGPRSESDESSPRTHISFFKTYFIFVLLSGSAMSKERFGGGSAIPFQKH